jgi:hypothetical protein
MNGILSINADEITCSGTITSDIIKASNLLEADTPETITAQWTYNVLPQSSVVPTLGNQLVNKTYVDGTLGSYVTLGTNQTISGLKTFSGNVRINNSRGLMLGTTYPTAGGFIGYTTPNLYYDVAGGGYHNFFIAGVPSVDIDSGGLVIRTGKKVQFYAGSTIYENSGGNSFDTNIPTGYTYKFKINSVDKLTIHPTFGATFTDNVNIQSDKYLNFSGGSYLLEEPSFTNLIYNVPTANKHQFRVNGVDTVAISADTNGSILTFPSGTIMREYTSFNWFLYQLPAGHNLIYQAGGTNVMEVSTGGVVMYEKISLRNGKTVTWDEGFTNIAYLRKDTTTSTLDYEVATGYTHKFMVNGVSQLLLNASGATFTQPIFMKATQPIYLDDTLLGGAIASGGSGGIRFDADTGGTFRFINDSTLALTIDGTNITIPSNQNLQLGITGSNISYQAGLNKIQYKVPTGKTHDFLVNNISAAIIDASGVVIQSTAVGAAFPTQNLYLSQNKLSYIGSSTTDIRYNCAASGSHNFYQNTSTYLGFWNSLGISLSPNNASLQIGTSSPIQIKHDTATTELQYRTLGGYEHMFYIDGSLYYEMRTDTFRALRGYQNKAGATGAYVSNNFNFSWNTPSAGNLSVWIDNTRLGNMSIVSDYRLKENIVPARPVLDRLCRIKMIEYEFKNVSIFKKNGISHGFIAHQVAELFPELINIIHGEKDALTADGDIQPQTVGGELTNLYLSGIQELNIKCIAQQAQIDAQQTQMEAMQKQIDALLVLFSQSRV